MNKSLSGTKVHFNIYTPDSPLKNPGRFVAEMINDLVRGRELAWRLAVRDISAQYRQTALGLLWAFILPLVNTITWIFLQNSGVVGVSDTALPYPVYVFTGTMIWAIFTESFNAPLQVTTSAKPMLSKINFPREALIVSGLLQSLFNAGIKVIILLIVLSFMGFINSYTILLFPIALVSLMLAGTAFGLLLTPIGLLYSDIGKVIPLMMQFLMYLTPVVFPMPKTGIAATIFTYNPLAPLIMTARDWLTGAPATFLNGFLWVNLLLIILLLLVWVIYKLALPILIERMNA